LSTLAKVYEKERIMNLQMQLKRGLVALAIWVLLGGFVLSHAGANEARAAAAIHAALRTSATCESSLRIDLTQSLRVTMPCDRSCAPVREVMRALHVPVRTSAPACQAHTA
jgi:hypothetical protein